jgi:hypothetical protein
LPFFHFRFSHWTFRISYVFVIFPTSYYLDHWTMWSVAGWKLSSDI